MRNVTVILSQLGFVGVKKCFEDMKNQGIYSLVRKEGCLRCVQMRLELVYSDFCLKCIFFIFKHYFYYLFGEYNLLIVCRVDSIPKLLLK